MSHEPLDSTPTTGEVPQDPWYPDLFGRVSFPPAAAADTVALTGGPVWRIDDLAAFWQRPVAIVERWLLARRHPAPRRDPDGEPYWLPAEIRAYAAGDVASASTAGRGRGSGRPPAEVRVTAPTPAARTPVPPAGQQPLQPPEPAEELPAIRLIVGGEVVA